MRRPDASIALTISSVLLGGCATWALHLAPERPDLPWAPVTNADGEIVPGKQELTESARERGHVLPSNRALASVPPAPSNLDAAHAYTLPELIDIAETNNPQTRVAWDEARNVALAAGIAESAYLPGLSAGVVGGYQTGHDRNSALGVTTTNDSTVHGAISTLSLQWLLFDFGERGAVVEAAKQGSVISNIAFTGIHQKVIYEVSLAFYANAAAQAHVDSARQSLKDAEEVQGSTEDRNAHGVGTIVEVAQARQATAQARLAQVQAESSAQNSYLALISAMGISPLTTIKIADVSGRKLSADMLEPIEHIVSEALTRRPDILGADAARRVSLANLRAAQAEFLPKLFLSANGTYSEGDLSVTALPSVGEQAGTVNVSGHHFGSTVLLGVTVPLYDGGTRMALLEQARSKADRANATFADVRNQAVREVVKAGNAVKTSLAAYEASESLASAAQTTFDAALAAYRHGVGSITAVTLAETQLLQAKNAATDAYSLALSAAATLALSAGTLGSAPK